MAHGFDYICTKSKKYKLIKMSHGTPKFSAFVFTVNNYNEEWESDMERLYDEGFITYVVVGKEEGDEKKTPHLQGYCELKKRTRLGKIKELSDDFKRAHVERRRGTPSQAADYCRKDGDWKEWGTMKILEQGKRNDLVKLRELVMGGETDMLTIMNECDAAFKYQGAVKEYIRLFKNGMRKPMLLKLRGWQAEIWLILKGPVHPRQILWFWEKTGGFGKSTFAKWLARTQNAFYSTGGKSADIAYAYQDEKIVVFDLPRTSAEYMNYNVVEQLKNGMIFSGKYQSEMKFFEIPHVVVFANYEPDTDKLSQDRWFIKELN